MLSILMEFQISISGTQATLRPDTTQLDGIQVVTVGEPLISALEQPCLILGFIIMQAGRLIWRRLISPEIDFCFCSLETR